MTRLDRYFLPTEREAPADAEALSHKLGVARRAHPPGRRGPVELAAGRLARARERRADRARGDRPHRRPGDAHAADHAGGAWKRSGRYDIEEVFKLKDRRGADLILALSHEETVTLHVAQMVRSYRQLPMLLYHFQTKGRDEARPRAGVLRTREFIMKDAYSFDRDEEGLDASYEKFVEAYDRICDRVGLEWYRVESDVGMMGGSGAHEYMAPCPAGENDVALAPGYAANTEVASADPQPVAPIDLEGDLHTPGATTIAAVADAPRRPGRQRAQGLSGGHRVARAGHGLRARRPPRQRDQARQRAAARASARRREDELPGPGRLPRARRPTSRRSTTTRSCPGRTT